MPWIHGNQYIMYQINQSNPYVINCTMYQIVTFNICWTMLNQYGHGSMPWQPWHLGWGWVNGTFTGTIHLQVCCNASWRKITYQCSSRFPPPTRWMIYNVCVLSHRHPSLKSSYQTNSHHINPISYHSNPLTKKKNLTPRTCPCNSKTPYLASERPRPPVADSARCWSTVVRRETRRSTWLNCWITIQTSKFGMV